MMEIIPTVQETVKHMLTATEADRDELEVLRRLGVIKLFSAVGTDEENEKAWLSFFNADEDSGVTVFVAEPGIDRESK